MANRMSTRARRVLLCTALIIPVVTPARPVSALPPVSYDLDPSTGRPYDQTEYLQEEGWQGNPSSPTRFAFWPTCTGTEMKDGTIYRGGRSTYCLRGFQYRKTGTTSWVDMLPVYNAGSSSGLMWTERNVSDFEGLGPSMSVSNRVLGMTIYGTDLRKPDPDTVYRVKVNVGDMDFVAMRSSGSEGAFTQAMDPSGQGSLLVADARPGATSVVIPARDTCVGEVRATKSTNNTFSVSLFDRKLFPSLVPLEGVVLESDAYPSANSYFPQFDPRTGGFTIKVCAPHLKEDGSLNVGYYRLLLTSPMLEKMGYYFRLGDGATVTDGRLLSADQVAELESRAASDFALSSTEQGTVASTAKLVIDPVSGEVGLRISGDIHYSGPVVSVVRTGPGVWPISDNTTSSKTLSVGYRNTQVSKGTLYAELLTKAGRKVVAKTSGKAKPLGSAVVSLPKKTKAGDYVLRVYVVGAKVKGKSKTTTIQELPVSLTVGG